MGGREKYKYDKIYQKTGILSKGKPSSSKHRECAYGVNANHDRRWDRYGHANEGRSLISRILNLNPFPASVVDIGCGYNEFIKQFSERCKSKIKKHMKKRDGGSAYNKALLDASNNIDRKLIGVDISCPGADIIAPAHELPFQDDQWDLLVSFDCLEHIPEEEIEPAFKEFRRVARRIFVKISLAESATLIDGEPLHVCVKEKKWWIDQIQKYFPTVEVVSQVQRDSPRDHVVIYAIR